MFKNNDLVIVKNLGDGKEYRGIIFGEIHVGYNFYQYIVYMIDKVPGHEQFSCAGFLQSCIERMN